MTQPWVRKYFPRKASDIHGQEQQINKLKDFILNYKKQRKKAALIYGPSGCGKTAGVYSIANELNLEIIEVNASDFRNEEQINLKVGNAIRQYSLFNAGKVILIDEIDGLHGREDYGGVAAITRLIEESIFPIVMTSNNPYDQKFSQLRNKSEMLQFNGLNYIAVFNVLKKICEAENIDFDEESLRILARREGGDLRAAISDLQSLTEESRKLKKEEIDELTQRAKVETMISALVKVFRVKDAKIAVNAFENVEEDIDKQFLWIDENLPYEYKKPEDLCRAYDKLSKADVFRGRITRWQHYRFLDYVNTLITAGIAAAKDDKIEGYTAYKPTTRILKLWQAKMKYQKRKEIARKIARKTHSNSREIISDTMPYVRIIFKKNKNMADNLARYFDFNKEEVEWLSA